MEKRDEENLNFLGFFGIIKETTRVILSCKKTLIFPLSFIFFAYVQTSHLLFLSTNQHNLHFVTQMGSNEMTKKPLSFSFEQAAFWVFKLAYFAFLLALSLLSTSSLVHTVATSKRVFFADANGSFALVFIYVTITGFFFLLGLALEGLTSIGFLLTLVPLIIYFTGFVYSILENIYGANATEARKTRVRGKIGTSLSLSLVLLISFAGIELLFENFVMVYLEPKLGFKIGAGILSAMLVFKVFLYGVVLKNMMEIVRKRSCYAKGQKCPIEVSPCLANLCLLDV